MRLPVSSETDAFRAVLVIVTVGGASLGLGYLTGAGVASPILGGALFCVGVLAAFSWAVAHTPEGSPVHDAEAEGDLTGGSRRILLIAGEAPTDEQLTVLRSVDPGAGLDVHALVLQSKTHFVTTDIDRETELARMRLRHTLELAASAGRAGIARAMPATRSPPRTSAPGTRRYSRPWSSRAPKATRPARAPRASTR